ncbi:MAG TPA: hypothetical protein VKE88_00295 [Candidatus Nanoarchaeia archaeon]|nr:hypothetical protein [Candidatus Nanoarchaeia archaeon]
MAGANKAPQVAKLEVNIDKDTYDTFVRACTQKGFATRTIVERLIKKFNETGIF